MGSDRGRLLPVADERASCRCLRAPDPLSCAIRFVEFPWVGVQKRRRVAALQDAIATHGTLGVAPAFGVRRPGAAFLAGQSRRPACFHASGFLRLALRQDLSHESASVPGGEPSPASRLRVPDPLSCAIRFVEFPWVGVQKRRQVAALQDAIATDGTPAVAPAFGVRRPGAAFLAGTSRRPALFPRVRSSDGSSFLPEAEFCGEPLALFERRNAAPARFGEPAFHGGF